MKRKTVFLLVSFTIILFVLSIGVLNHFGISIYSISQVSCGCQDRIPDHYYLILGIILIMASIPITYYYISKKMEQKLNEHVESLSRIVNKRKNKPNKSSLSSEDKILKFLNPSEQKIVKILLKSDGERLQSQIAKLGNMTKLQVHRIVKGLEQKNIIETEPYGKTKKISLTNEFKKSLKF